MNILNDDGIQGAFRALADPTRREILVYLSKEDMTIGDVAGHFAITRAAVKKHLTILEAGDLITVHPRGRERVNRLRPEGLKTATDWLDYFQQFWDQRLDALKTAAEAEERKNND
ncbi:MAG: metalloregulator ArsR/SmtB family transcription factor [Proteobacteria bacterium]|nr:metalloregulator ArsR/SmtB family transcription factor [Pseudomonadota bacterium]